MENQSPANTNSKPFTSKVNGNQLSQKSQSNIRLLVVIGDN